jgi:hypothetical protein
MCDKFIKVKYQAVSRQQTINNNGTFTLLNVFAEVIEALTTFQVMCFSTTEYRELCGFQLSLHKDAIPCVCIYTS